MGAATMKQWCGFAMFLLVSAEPRLSAQPRN
jgi:hypothetical protein